MKFSSAGQATQMIIGASPETDYQIIRLSSGLYKKFNLKRVFYSAYIAKNEDSALPAPLSSPPLLREHRLYQADFLMRFYKFSYNEILDERCQSFNPYIDPKANWAINNFHHFPVDVNKADKNTLLRVPGIGPRGAEKILEARRFTQLTTEDLRRMGIVLKRAQFFLITADNKKGARFSKDTALRALIDPTIYSFGTEQLTFFDAPGLPGAEDVKSIAEAAEEAVLCLSKAL